MTRRINRVVSAVRCALTSVDFQRRFAAAAPELQSEVEALALAELERCGVSLTGLKVIVSWEPSSRRLTASVDAADLDVAKLRSIPHDLAPTRS